MIDFSRIKTTLPFFRPKRMWTLELTENVYIPCISLLIGCLFQLYTVLDLNTRADMDKSFTTTSFLVILFSTFINLCLFFINSNKVINLYKEVDYKLNIYVVILIIILLLSGLCIMIIPAFYLNNENDRSIFCTCNNGEAKLSLIPSNKYCCKSCMPNYDIKNYEDQTICSEI